MNVSVLKEVEEKHRSLWGQRSYLHLALGQISPELLGRVGDLPLVSQQVDAQMLDITEGQSQGFSSNLYI